MPPALHLILTSRIDPNLTLSWVRGELLEIHTDDLRFSHQVREL